MQELLNQLFWMRMACLHVNKEFYFALQQCHADFSNLEDCEGNRYKLCAVIRSIAWLIMGTGFDLSTATKQTMRRNGYTDNSQMLPVLDIWDRE
jgi:hypothetical protein